MSALSVKYLNNFLKGSFVIKNPPYVNAAVSQQAESRPESQPEVEQRTYTCVCVCVCMCVCVGARKTSLGWNWQYMQQSEGSDTDGDLKKCQKRKNIRADICEDLKCVCVTVTLYLCVRWMGIKVRRKRHKELEKKKPHCWKGCRGWTWAEHTDRSVF